MPHDREHTADAQSAPRADVLVEMRESYPALDFVHEIEVRGGCNWSTLMSIGIELSRVEGRLESLAARRYVDGGEVTTIRVRDLDDARLREAVEGIRRLQDVANVSITHIFAL